MADGNLFCERETRNSHDLQALTIKKTTDGTLQIVRRMPRKTSSICSIFLRRGGSITLYYRCALVKMCKNLDGENLVNFWSVINFAKFLWYKISLHTVLSIWITIVRIHCIVAYDFAVIMIIMVSYLFTGQLYLW